jgi:hypothetical protein
MPGRIPPVPVSGIEEGLGVRSNLLSPVKNEGKADLLNGINLISRITPGLSALAVRKFALEERTPAATFPGELAPAHQIPWGLAQRLDTVNSARR